MPSEFDVAALRLAGTNRAFFDGNHGPMLIGAADEIERQAAEIVALRANLLKLANACDAVGIQHFDTDDMSSEVEAMQAATLDARAALATPAPDAAARADDRGVVLAAQRYLSTVDALKAPGGDAVTKQCDLDSDLRDLRIAVGRVGASESGAAVRAAERAVIEAAMALYHPEPGDVWDQMPTMEACAALAAARSQQEGAGNG